MDDAAEIEAVTQLCERLGADRKQAKTMAQQLIKRSSQLAEERGTSRTAAMQGLLEVLVSGRKGYIPKGFGGKNSDKTDT